MTQGLNGGNQEKVLYTVKTPAKDYRSLNWVEQREGGISQATCRKREMAGGMT